MSLKGAQRALHMARQRDSRRRSENRTYSCYMVGSKDFYDEKIDGQVNVTTRRASRSSFKPFVYAAALHQRGYQPETMVLDAPTVPVPAERTAGDTIFRETTTASFTGCFDEARLRCRSTFRPSKFFILPGSTRR